MSESFDKLKEQKEKILNRQKTKALEESVAIGFDAVRVCVGINPKQYTVDQIILWMRMMTENNKP